MISRPIQDQLGPRYQGTQVTLHISSPRHDGVLRFPDWMRYDLKMSF